MPTLIVPFVISLVTFVVKELNHKGHQGLHKSHRAKSA
jgi:hypothetical protein